MRVSRLWLRDFRNYTAADVEFAPDGLTVVTGGNGEGKSNLLEAVAWLSTLRSFRGVADGALIRTSSSQAIVRAQADRDGRPLLLEAEINRDGRNRVMVNRQPLRRARDLLGALRTSVFSPDDLRLVKGGPGERRGYLDETLVALSPKIDATLGAFERSLRQRSTLLRQVGGRLDAAAAVTLDVWDAKLSEAGEALAAERAALAARLAPALSKAVEQLAPGSPPVAISYLATWRDDHGSLAAALAAARHDDVRRGATTIGPHRDDLVIELGSLPARTHASQGEQRTVALALRLAAHLLVGDEAGSPPVLLLDDVFSELDPERGEALVAALPDGQAILTTAGSVPPSARPAARVEVRAGSVL